MSSSEESVVSENNTLPKRFTKRRNDVGKIASNMSYADISLPSCSGYQPKTPTDSDSSFSTNDSPVNIDLTETSYRSENNTLPKRFTKRKNDLGKIASNMSYGDISLPSCSGYQPKTPDHSDSSFSTNDSSVDPTETSFRSKSDYSHEQLQERWRLVAERDKDKIKKEKIQDFLKFDSPLLKEFRRKKAKDPEFRKSLIHRSKAKKPFDDENVCKDTSAKKSPGLGFNDKMYKQFFSFVDEDEKDWETCKIASKKKGKLSTGSNNLSIPNEELDSSYWETLFKIDSDPDTQVCKKKVNKKKKNPVKKRVETVTSKTQMNSGVPIQKDKSSIGRRKKSTYGRDSRTISDKDVRSCNWVIISSESDTESDSESLYFERWSKRKKAPLKKRVETVASKEKNVVPICKNKISTSESHVKDSRPIQPKKKVSSVKSNSSKSQDKDNRLGASLSFCAELAAKYSTTSHNDLKNSLPAHPDSSMMSKSPDIGNIGVCNTNESNKNTTQTDHTQFKKSEETILERTKRLMSEYFAAMKKDADDLLATQGKSKETVSDCMPETFFAVNENPTEASTSKDYAESTESNFFTRKKVNKRKKRFYEFFEKEDRLVQRYFPRERLSKPQENINHFAIPALPYSKSSSTSSICLPELKVVLHKLSVDTLLTEHIKNDSEIKEIYLGTDEKVDVKKVKIHAIPEEQVLDCVLNKEAGLNSDKQINVNKKMKIHLLHDEQIIGNKIPRVFLKDCGTDN